MPPLPTLTIIIPTLGRPTQLPRAVASAVACAERVDIEVMVVPNGPDISWHASLSQYIDHPAVRVLPIKMGHANVARNHGMRHARGGYIRFLDDDDVLYTGGVARQVATLEQTGADVCSATIDLADDAGIVMGEWRQDTTTDDFAASSCSHRRALQMTAHVFRKSAVDGLPWDESLPYSQDICWILDLIGQRELRWVKLEDKVGCWHRHVGTRISTNASTQRRRQLIAERLRAVASTLADNGRLTEERRQAIADGVWEQIHDAFYLSPAYWWNVGRWASAFCPGSHPPIRLFEYPLVKKLSLDPLVWETLTFPRRMAKHAVKAARYKTGLARWW